MKRNVIAVAAVFLIGSTCLLLHTQEKKAFPKELTGDQLYQQGLELFKQGKYQEAVTTFLEASQRKTNFADAYYQMGLCYIKLLDGERARQNLISARILFKDEGMKKQTAFLIEKFPEEIAQGKKEQEKKEQAKKEQQKEEERRKREEAEKRKQEAEKQVASEMNNDEANLPRQTKAEVVVQLGHTGKVTCVAFSPDGKLLLSGSEDKTAKLWEVDTGKLIHTFGGYLATISNVGFFPDGKTIFLGSHDYEDFYKMKWIEEMNFCNISTGSELMDFSGIYSTDTIGFSPDGKLMTIMYGVNSKNPENYTLRGLWDIITRKKIVLSHKPANNTSSLFLCRVAFSADGKIMFEDSNYDGGTSYWDTTTRKEIMAFGTGKCRIIALSPDGKIMLIVNADGTSSLWDVGSRKKIQVFWSGQWGVGGMSPDGRFELMQSSGNSFLLFKRRARGSDERVIRKFIGHKNPIFSLGFSPDGKTILSRSEDGIMKLWNVNADTELLTFEHTKQWKDVTFSPDGKFIRTISWLSPLESTSTLWRVSTGEKLHTTSGDSFIGYSLDRTCMLSTDAEEGMIELQDIVQDKVIGKFIVIDWNNSNFLRVFKQNKELIKTFCKGRSVGAITVSPSRKLLCYAIKGDTTLRLRNIDTDKDVRIFRGYSNAVRFGTFSPDGQFLLTTGFKDKSFRLWNVQEGKGLQTFWHTAPVESLAFSSDGKQILSAGSHELALWNISSVRPVRTFSSGAGDPWFRNVTFLPGDRLALSLGDVVGDISLWDITAGDRKRLLRQYGGNSYGFDKEIDSSVYGKIKLLLHEKDNNAKFISKDGTLFLSVKEDDGMRADRFLLYDANTGEEMTGIFHPRTGSKRFSLDGTWEISGSKGGTIKPYAINIGGGWIEDKDIRTILDHGPVGGVLFSPKYSHDGNMLFSTGRDGTARLWNVATGEEIAQMISFYSYGWIVLTPEGFYNASPQAAQYLNVRLGNTMYDLNQFYDAFYRPDLVEKKLKGEDIAKYTGGLTIEEALKNPPPKVTVLSPKEGEGFTDRKATVKVKIEDSGGGIGDIRVYHNGKLVESLGVYRLARTEGGGQTVKLAKADSGSVYRTTKGTTLRRVQELTPKKESATVEFTPATGTVEKTYTMSLTKGENTISVSAFNGTNTVTSAMESITVQASVPEHKPEMYLLAIGDNTFADSAYNLTMAVKDATDFTETIKNTTASLYAKVNTQLLTNANKEGILQTISTLSSRMQPEDVFVLYVATHGRAEDDLYYLYTSEFDGDLGNPRTCISSIELMELSKRIPALKQVFVLDTCMAGGMESIVSGLYDARISVLAKSLGMHIFAGTKTYQEALDNYEGNGLFTHFVLAGLKGGADENKNKEVSVFEMDPYLTKLVKEASKGSQEPFIRTFGEDLPVTRVEGIP